MLGSPTGFCYPIGMGMAVLAGSVILGCWVWVAIGLGYPCGMGWFVLAGWDIVVD